MSKLSEYFRRMKRSRIIEGVVEYLETVDLPGPAKKAIVMTVVKTITERTNGRWNAEVEAAVSGAIEYALGEVREWARRNDPTPDDDPNVPKVPVPPSTPN